MRKIIMAAAFMTPLLGTGAADAACAPSHDCGTVLATGFGTNCVWIRVQSTVFDKLTIYGLLPTDVNADRVSTVGIKGGPIAIRPGLALPQCQGIINMGDTLSIDRMSNDPADQ